MHPILLFAVALAILWLVLKLALAVTSGLLHLLWIAALVMGAVWLFNRLRGKQP